MEQRDLPQEHHGFLEICQLASLLLSKLETYFVKLFCVVPPLKGPSIMCVVVFVIGVLTFFNLLSL